jgi:hypothetical protein
MPKSFQIALSDGEKSKLIDRIERDFEWSKTSHVRYAEQCRQWMQRWQARVDAPRIGDEDKPNHVVPLTQWHVFGKLARDMQALLGEDAEITARPTGPSDASKVRKIGRYMTSRVFDQMEILNPLCEFEFRRILNGWSAAYRPWWRREFDTLEGGKRKRVCDYEGPGFFPLEPDDLMVPPERGVSSIHDFSYTIRRVRVTVDDLIRGDGTLYQGTSDPEMVKKLIDWANQGSSNDYTMNGQDPVRAERERSEGVDYQSYMPGGRSIWMWEWYGFWRPLTKKSSDAAPEDIDQRDLLESDWVVKFIPGLREIVSVQDLLELYPKMRRRRPFVESTLIKDGTYRPAGFGKLLGDLEDDATANSRLFQAAGELSVWPIIFFKPGGGMHPGKFKIDAGMAVPTEDPASVNVVKIAPNMDFLVARQQDILATAERVDSITDQSLGRNIDRPNAPKTATGQLALIEEGNVRAYLDSTILREDMEKIIADFWALDCDLVPKTEPGLFFRVTEEQAGGLFDVRQGGSFMTAKEFGGKFDFRLKFAVSTFARERKKQEFVTFYGACMQNPLIMQNPKALWVLLNKLAKEFGIEDFSSIIPEPPDLDQPKQPEDEWTEMLEGDAVEVNPQDNDQQHIVAHTKELEAERKDPDRDVQAIGLMVKHILDHQAQMRTKQLMSALTNQLAQSLMPPQQSPAQQAINHITQIYGGIPGMQGPQGPQGPPPPQGPAPFGQPAAPAGGDVPPPPQQVGASAPQPVEGML